MPHHCLLGGYGNCAVCTMETEELAQIFRASKALREHIQNETKGLMYEDDLPADISKEDYAEWYKTSRLVYGVRMGEIFPKENLCKEES